MRVRNPRRSYVFLVFVFAIEYVLAITWIGAYLGH